MLSGFRTFISIIDWYFRWCCIGQVSFIINWFTDWFFTKAFCKVLFFDHATENYRPVSLTSVPCKFLENIICKHIIKYLDRHRILTSLNHGFRSGYSCETQLLVTLRDFMKTYDAGLQTNVAILDFPKAFDTVPHKKLLSKMDSYGIRGSINNLLNMFLMHRKMKAVVEGEQSEEVTVDGRVPQGTVLGRTVTLPLSHKGHPRCSKIFSKTVCKRESTLHNHQISKGPSTTARRS